MIELTSFFIFTVFQVFSHRLQIKLEYFNGLLLLFYHLQILEFDFVSLLLANLFILLLVLFYH
jgi:hypothetical protein